ncbi:MAG: hypothetical protein J5911_04480 [Clostridia bacterium]|nr:hypothetical protein [Clostridia bacterium]
MVTTRRSDGFSKESVRGVDLLERENSKETAAARVESRDEVKAKMHSNLEKLLNYDRYSALEAEKEKVIDLVPKTDVVEKETKCSEEDIRPTTTTTQFIDGDPQVFNDAKKSQESAKNNYKLNAKGKFVVVMYALVVTVILALIALNTGVLKSLTAEVNDLNRVYAEKAAIVQEQDALIEEISAPERIIEIAQNDLGMVLR